MWKRFNFVSYYWYIEVITAITFFMKYEIHTILLYKDQQIIQNLLLRDEISDNCQHLSFKQVKLLTHGLNTEGEKYTQGT